MTDKNVPAINLKQQYLNLKIELDPKVAEVLNSGWYLLGKRLEEFEDKFAEYIGTKYCVGVATGTDALTLSLKALGLGQGDNVIVPANVYPTSFGVALSGVTLKLVDVDPQTHSIDPVKLEQAIDQDTKAIVAVHLYGNPVNLTEIKRIAQSSGVYLVEDCAQAAGALYEGKKVGTYGDLSCFSFYPTKNLGAFGDGGAVLTDNPDLAEKVKLLRMYGEQSRYKSVLVGHNSRLDELQAAVLSIKLSHLDKWNSRRGEIARMYTEGLKELPLGLVGLNSNSQSAYHLFVVMTEKRDELMSDLITLGIGVGIHYPFPIHLTDSYKNLGYKEGDFPVSEKISKTTLSLPIYPEMTDEDVNYVIDSIHNFFS